MNAKLISAPMRFRPTLLSSRLRALQQRDRQQQADDHQKDREQYTHPRGMSDERFTANEAPDGSDMRPDGRGNDPHA